MAEAEERHQDNLCSQLFSIFFFTLFNTTVLCVSSFSVAKKSFLVVLLQHNSIISSPLRSNLTRGKRESHHRSKEESSLQDNLNVFHWQKFFTRFIRKMLLDAVSYGSIRFPSSLFFLLKIIHYYCLPFYTLDTC